eukprot:symbB.v1.2.037231.t1/scaffold5440.1/size27174/2
MQQEIVVSYGVHYDHSPSKKARISDWFNTSPKPEPEPNPAPPVPVPELPVPKPMPVPTPAAPAPPAPPAPARAPAPKPPFPKPTSPAGPGSVMVASLEDPPMKLMLTSDGGLQIVSMDAEANKKLKKLTILKWVNQGQLVKSTNRPPKSIPYDVTLTSFAYDFSEKPITTLKELIKRYSVTEVHGYDSFPAGAPTKLVKSHAT